MSSSSSQQRSKRQAGLAADGSSKARFGSGLVSLGGAPKQPAQSKTTTVGGKLAAPPPVNLPSLRKEHAGNDPNAQLVNQGWSKERPPALSTSSHWASGGSKPEQAHGTGYTNAADYPSLAAAARSGPSTQVAPRVVDRYSSGRSWEDDERGGPPSRPPPPPPARAASPSWNHDEAATPSNRHWRDAEPVRRRWDDAPDRWGQSDRWNGADRRRPPDYGASALLRDDLDDAALFPPAPSRQVANAAAQAQGSVEDDPERAAFEQELERLASQLHKQREGVVEALPPPPPPPTHAAAVNKESTRAQEAEEEQARRQAAARKLRALEQRMAAQQDAEKAPPSTSPPRETSPSAPQEAPPSPYAFGTNLADEVASFAQLQVDEGADAGDLLGALPADLYLDTPPGSLVPPSHMAAAAAQYASFGNSTPGAYQDDGLWAGWQQPPTYASGLFGVQSPVAQQEGVLMQRDGVLGQPFVQTHRQPDWSVGRPG